MSCFAALPAAACWPILCTATAFADDIDPRVGSRLACGADASRTAVAETPYNGQDDDCDPATPDDDLDGDGSLRLEDCDDTVPGEARVHEGAVSWPSKASPCKGGLLTVLRGDLLISGAAADLAGLSCLCAVSGSVRVQKTERLEDLRGLEHLTTVKGDVAVEGNAALSEVRGLSGLRSVGGDVRVAANAELRDVSGLENLSEVGGALSVASNPSMTDLGGLDAVRVVGGDLAISNNDALKAVEGLQSLEAVAGALHIDENAALTAVHGFDTLRTIGGELEVSDNPKLSVVDGLVVVGTIGAGALVEGNPALDEGQVLSRLARQTDTPAASRWPHLGPVRSLLLAFFLAAGIAGTVLVSRFVWKWLYPDAALEVEGPRLGPDAFAHLRFDGTRPPPGSRWPLALKDVPAPLLALAEPHAELVEAAYGDVLIRQDDADAAVAWVIEGELAVAVDGVEVGRVLPEELVGEMSLFEDAYRGAGVSAVAPTRMLVIEREAYKALTAMNHPVARILEQVAIMGMGRKLRDTAKRLGGEVQLSTRKRPGALDRDTVLERLRAFAAALTPAEGGTRAPTPALVLGVSPVFGHVPRDMRDAIAARMRFKDYEPGQPILVQGDPGADMFVLASGRVDVLLASPTQPDLVRIDDLHPGDMFGLAQLFHEAPHVASCVALGPVSCAVLPAVHVRELCASDGTEGRMFRIAAALSLAAALREANAALAGQPTGGDQAANLHDVRSILVDRK